MKETSVNSRAHFLNLVKPIFVEYLRRSSKGLHNQCADIINILLDLPAKSLSKSGGARKLQQRLEKYVPIHDQILQSIMEGAHEETCQPPSEDTKKNQASGMGGQETENIMDRNEAKAVKQKRAAVPQKEEHIEEEKEAPPLDLLTRLVRRAISIIREGGPRAWSRAAKVLSQTGSASINEETIKQLRDLHPQSKEKLSSIPMNHAPDIISVDPMDLILLIKKIDNGSAPGPSGFCASFLRLIAECGEEEPVLGLCALIKDICNGVFTGEIKKRLLSHVLIPIPKIPGQSAVRPIAMGEVFVKLAALYRISLIEQDLPSFFSSIQYGVKKPGGSEAAAQITKALYNHAASLDLATIILKTDFANAFNACFRGKVWETLLSLKKTEPIWKLFYWCYSSPSPLLLYDRNNLHTILESTEGVRQGDPFAALCFSLLVQSLYEEALQGLTGSHGVAIQDDLSLVGPYKLVMEAYDRIIKLAPKYHLKLRIDKCAVWTPPTLTDPSVLNPILVECNKRSLSHTTKVEILGVMFGSDEDVMEYCEKIADSQQQFLDCLTHPEMPVQIAFSLLRFSAHPRLSYLARTVHPDLFRPAAEKYDRKILDTFLKIFQIKEESLTYLEPALSKENLLVQVSLPISKGGFGLRPFSRTSHPAFFSSLISIMPDLTKLINHSDIKSYQSLKVHSELMECRQELIAKKVLLPLEKPSLPPMTRRSISHCKPNPLFARPAPLRNRRPSHKGPVGPAEDNQPAVSSSSLQSNLTTITHSIDDLWPLAKSNQSNPTQFCHPLRLQANLTFIMENHIYNEMFLSTSPTHRVTLTSLSVPGSSEYLTVLPTDKVYQVPDTAMRLAARMRMGLLPFDHLHHSTCPTCPANRCGVEDAPFITDPYHLLACKQLVTHQIARHDNMVQVLVDCAKVAGYTCKKEPYLHVRPDNINKGDKHYDDRADILMMRHSQLLYVDVQICRPTAPFCMRQYPVAIQSIPLQSTLKKEKQKQLKYGEISRKNNYDFIPFVLESLGGLGECAQRLIKTLAKQVTGMSETQFIKHARRRISVALQIGNANSLLESLQKIYMLQYNQIPHQPLRGRGQKAHPQWRPINSDRLGKRVNKIISHSSALTASSTKTSGVPASTPNGGSNGIQFNWSEHINSADMSLRREDDEGTTLGKVIDMEDGNFNLDREANIHRCVYFNFAEEIIPDRWEQGVAVVTELDDRDNYGSPATRRSTSSECDHPEVVDDSNSSQAA